MAAATAIEDSVGRWVAGAGVTGDKTAWATGAVRAAGRGWAGNISITCRRLGGRDGIALGTGE